VVKYSCKRMGGIIMGLFIAGGLVLLFWIASKIEEYSGERAYKKYQEKSKELGLK
jgi:hypothetical protein